MKHTFWHMGLVLSLFFSTSVFANQDGPTGAGDIAEKQPQVFEIYNWADLLYRNGLEPGDCFPDRNPHDVVGRKTAAYYACRRIQNLLKVDLTAVPSNNKKNPYVNVLGPKNSTRNALTVYMVQPPLEPGYGIDWSSADALIRSAYSNLTTDVIDNQGNPIPNHGIGHIFARLECEGRKPILTGMTTADDLEAPKNMFAHNLGLGILFRTQEGKFNSYEELQVELDQRKDSVGNVFYTEYLLSKVNCDHTYYSIMEMVAENVQKKYGSLTDRAFNGTGMGCVMFGAGVQQMARVMPEVRSAEGYADKGGDHLGLECKFYNQWKRTIYVPQDYLPHYKKDTGTLEEANIGLLSLLFSGDNSDRFVIAVKALMEKLAASIPEDFGEGDLKEKYSDLYSFLSTWFGIFKSELDKFIADPSRNKSLANISHQTFQYTVHGKKFLREELKVKRDGYNWAKPGEKAFELTFWDPQMYSDWVQKVRWEMEGLEKGTLSQSQKDAINCIDHKRPFSKTMKPVSEGKNLGVQIDMTGVDVQLTIVDNPYGMGSLKIINSYFQQYDYMRAIAGTEEVDAHGFWDSEADLVDAIEDLTGIK